MKYVTTYLQEIPQRIVKRICRYVFNDSKSAGLRPDRNDYELNVQEEIQKVYIPKTR